MLTDHFVSNWRIGGLGNTAEFIIVNEVLSEKNYAKKVRLNTSDLASFDF